jgi:hypothetical protein
VSALNPPPGAFGGNQLVGEDLAVGLGQRIGPFLLDYFASAMFRGM